MSQIIQVTNKTLMEEIREEASRRIVAKGGYRGTMQFLDALAQEGLVVWLEYFPRICEEMREVNWKKRRMLEQAAEKGKFTESYGWSENGDFKWEFEYTPEFYFFMRNYVYTHFFDESRGGLFRKFMKGLMRGDDPMDLLMAVKSVYGSNQQENPVVHGGTVGTDH